MTPPKTLALNIETMASQAMMNSLPVPEVKTGNLRDAKKIADKEEQAAAKLRGKAALSPFYGRVLCVSLANMEGKVATMFNEDNEATLLDRIFAKIQSTDAAPVRIVTFNGAAFDIPFLRVRAMMNGVSCPLLETGRYRCSSIDSNHFDVYQYFENLLAADPMLESMKLANMAKLILGHDFPFESIDQSKLGELAKDATGRETIRALCEWNTLRTLELFKLLMKYAL